ncbi:hypothetical protein QT711_11525 [Sporosarcina saromensis]|uniref:Uncharacterized protein n=1 Tax=Sporosarcina saromensis TaxID=359365 RepID=A0ABU4G9Z5_9BACL|nr:hypothetical protein [Sporosarcina saromensis]MDW0113818.1 hypothetical protein [Sporosarcina saromensis]
MNNTLKFTGFFMILIGIVGGLINYNKIDTENYKMAQKVADELINNSVAQVNLASAEMVYSSQITIVILIVFLGIVGGLTLMGISKLLDLKELQIAEAKKQHSILEKALQNKED